MQKKRRMPILVGQIMFILLALLTVFVYFGVRQVSPILANPFMIIGFVFLAIALLLETVAYEKTSLRQINFSEEKSNSAIITPQAIKLHEALKERGIHNELEPFDGHKHVDISIPSAKLNLEIDGKYHLTDPEHLFRDLERDSFSHKKGISTIRIPNYFVDRHLPELADSIVEVARKRKNEIEQFFT